MGEAAAATRTNNKRVEYHLCPATHWICFVSRIKSYLSLGYYYYASWVKSIDFSLVTCDETRALISCSPLLFSALLCSAVAYMTYRSINHFSSGSHTHRTHTRQTIALMLARQHWLCRYIGNVLCLCFVMWYQFRKRPKRGTCTSLILQYSVGCAQNCRPFSIWFINNLAEIILRYWTNSYEEMSEINHFRSIADKCWGFMKLTHLFFAKRNQSELDVVDWIVIHFG